MFLQSHSRVPRADGEDFGEAGETRTVDEQRRGRYSVTSNKFFFFFPLAEPASERKVPWTVTGRRCCGSFHG